MQIFSGLTAHVRTGLKKLRDKGGSSYGVSLKAIFYSCDVQHRHRFSLQQFQQQRRATGRNVATTFRDLSGSDATKKKPAPLQSEKTEEDARVPFYPADFNKTQKNPLLIQSAAHTHTHTCFRDAKTNRPTGNTDDKPALHRPKSKFGFYQYLLADKTEIRPNSYTNIGRELEILNTANFFPSSFIFFFFRTNKMLPLGARGAGGGGGGGGGGSI